MSGIGDAIGAARAAGERLPGGFSPGNDEPVAGAPSPATVGLTATVEALLFLSSDPLTLAQLSDAAEAPVEAVEVSIEQLRVAGESGERGIVLREIAGGYVLASSPATEQAARRLFAKPRTPPLTAAQAECLAIVAYLQPVARPEIARIRGVSSESAVGTLSERGLIVESGRSQLGAVLYRTSELFEKLFGLGGLDQLPDLAAFDPDADDKRELRDRLLKAGERRATST